jgi:hypothetical protein
MKEMSISLLMQEICCIEIVCFFIRSVLSIFIEYLFETIDYTILSF